MRLSSAIPLTFLIALCCGAAAFAQQEEGGDYIHYRLGVKYKNEKKYDLAIQEFKRVLASYPDNYNAYMHCAEIRKLQGMPRLMIYDLKKALAYNPGWSKANKLLAEAYEQDGQLQKAINELQVYQQSCDPAERDSIQNKIDWLVARVSGETALPVAGGVPGDTGKHAAASAGPKKKQPAARVPKSGETALRQVYAQTLNPLAQEAFNEGVRLYGEEKYDASLDYMRKTIQLQPGYPGAYYYAGMIRRRQGQNDKAKTNFQKALSYADLGHNAYFYLGKIYGEEKNYPEAIKNLQMYLGLTTYDAGKEEARTLIEKFGGAVKAMEVQKPQSVDIKGVAESDLRTEIEKTEPDVPAMPIEMRIDSLLSMSVVDTLTPQGSAMLSGVRLFAAGKFDAAIKEFKQVQLSYPTTDAGAHCAYDIGICYMKMRLYPNAENQFQQVIERYPAHRLAAQSAFFKALSYTERREPAMGEKLFRDFILKYPKHDWIGKAYENLGDTYVDMEQHKKAIDAYAQAAGLATNPTDQVVVAYKTGISYSSIANPARAMECFRRAIDTGEKYSIYIRVPDSYYKIADYQYQKKEFKNALAIYEQATRKYPGYQDTPWGLFQIGNVYRNQKEDQKAIDTYKLLIQKYPDDYWAKQAQWKLDDTIWEHEYQAVLR